MKIMPNMYSRLDPNAYNIEFFHVLLISISFNLGQSRVS